MKTSAYFRFMAVASLAMAPLAAFSQETDATQACINAFVAQNFPGQAPIVKVERNSGIRMPLEFGRSASQVLVSAANRESGRVIASATCTEKNGVVKLTPVYMGAAAIVAAR